MYMNRCVYVCVCVHLGHARTNQIIAYKAYSICMHFEERRIWLIWMWILWIFNVQFSNKYKQSVRRNCFSTKQRRVVWNYRRPTLCYAYLAPRLSARKYSVYVCMCECAWCAIIRRSSAQFIQHKYNSPIIIMPIPKCKTLCAISIPLHQPLPHPPPPHTRST